MAWVTWCWVHLTRSSLGRLDLVRRSGSGNARTSEAHQSEASVRATAEAAFKPNMHVQDDVPLWQVDGVLAGEYLPYPPNPTNEHEMVCWDPKAYQEIKHHNESRLQLVLRSGLVTQGSSPACQEGIVRVAVECLRTRVSRLVHAGAFS